MSHNIDSACGSCQHNITHLTKLGVNMDRWNYVVALAGNPNTGKSTVFNQLTGLKQHTGNWPGKTVTRAEGGYSYKNSKYKLVDLPGTYSLLSTSTDEEIVRDFLLFGQPDVTVIVVDATRLERNLNLTLQILEITNRVVVCLNLMDEAARHGLQVNDRQLAKDLGVPVVPASARKREGIPELVHVISEVASGEIVSKLHKTKSKDPDVERAIKIMSKRLETKFPDLPNVRWVAQRLLEGDAHIEEAIRSGELGNLTKGNTYERKQDFDLKPQVI